MPLFSASLLPGQTITESVVVRNTGDVAFNVQLATNLDHPPTKLARSGMPPAAYRPRVRMADGTSVYSGPLGSINTALKLKLMPGQESPVSIPLTLAADARAPSAPATRRWQSPSAPTRRSS